MAEAPGPIAILGPTASGKSALAVAVAARTGGAVVNGDPFQAYAGLAIGTGQPTEAERHGVPHRGYGCLDLATEVNPAGFGAQVRAWLEEGPAPVLVTGSGLYLRGIWNQLTDLPEVPPALTLRVRAWAEALGGPVLHRYLAAVDPARAADLHPNDRSRIQRALALHLATGQRPSRLLSGVIQGVPPGWRAILVLPGRERQRARVAARVRAMVRAGWRREAEAVREAGQEADLRRLKPLGYLDWLDAPRGAEARIIQATQAYAKRQGTWFRNQWPELPVWDPDAEPVEVAMARLGVA
ncbi:tRNA (adenosine(37)-N6)-dimethylallyltransferase MiaA [Mesoterricola sediminis]|uniref:tRNA dimethylallyltransferase n=1 Tax=Mesoterricola sediminis TaxID=2927980 RepID=A0AA48GTK9_9BACT|nr:tRNA (adenosine(37)-N6)-dimethylallyltransferase MiaA [Mesoterricola sediminis]BDU77499.1 tRNA dimethylallyltransferase [Mesoterricola sediminis]